jgi:hypothetical protein
VSPLRADCEVCESLVIGAPDGNHGTATLKQIVPHERTRIASFAADRRERLALATVAFFASAVAAVVPDGFPAYVRILHPARGTNDVPVSWAKVAAWSGRRMHPLVQFHAISRTLPFSSVGPEPWNQDPEPGNLPAELLRVLCEILTGHTSTASSCCFCLWEGYGWLHGGPAVAVIASSKRDFGSVSEGSTCIPPALPLEVLHGPRVSLPQRNYVLFEGPLSAATALGWTTPYGAFFAQSPNLFWPRDHAWCVASEIDLFCTLVAGSEALAEALVAHPALEA